VLLFFGEIGVRCGITLTNVTQAPIRHPSLYIMHEKMNLRKENGNVPESDILVYE
jgi:hypothetical protein